MKEQDDRLEAWLAHTPQIDDGGFTEALMARLPARRPALWMRAAIPIAASIVSCGVAAALPGARELAVEVGLALAGSATAPGANPLVIAGLMALLVAGAVAAGASEI
jgi:hypothetical protein